MFSQQIQEWQIFYSTVALASAGLMGLIFLSLSLKLDIITKSKDEDLRHIAWQTFLNFFFLIMFALVFLVPEQTKLGLALPLITISTIAIIITLAQGIRSARAGTQFWKVCTQSVPSLVAFVGVIIIVMFVLLDHIQSLVWMLPVVIVLLAVAVRYAWELLVKERI
jgi:hypothetical protein